MRFLVGLCLLATLASGKPKSKIKGVPIPLRDLKPRLVKPTAKSLQRSRSGNKPGLWVGGVRHRGLGMPGSGRIAFDVDGNFTRLRVRVGVLDSGKEPVQFAIMGDGKKLVATPPLFAGAPPIQIEADLTNVVLLELVTSGTLRSRAAWVGGTLYALPGAKLSKYRATVKEFSPQAYPASFKRKVNKSIDRAAAHLKSLQRPDGTWRDRNSVPGTTALTALALLKSGVPRTDPSMVKAFQYLRAQRPRLTYDVAVLMMALEARYFPQGATPKQAVKLIAEADQEWMQQLADWMVSKQGAGSPQARKDRPVWRYPHAGYDLSCTQYAMFGLAAANRCGYATSKVWLPALRFILGMQQADGPDVKVARYYRSGRYVRRQTERAKARGFGYTSAQGPTGSMTTAGLCSIVLCQVALSRNSAYHKGYKERSRKAVRDALAWLEEHYTLDENPYYGTAWLNYYLFNLERVGVLLDQRYLGTRDWYREGCERYMKLQWDSGSWGGLVDTSFALLFMKKATVPPLTQNRR